MNCKENPNKWPPRSRYLTPHDFFLWGYLMSVVYQTLDAYMLSFQTRIFIKVWTSQCCPLIYMNLAFL